MKSYLSYFFNTTEKGMKYQIKRKKPKIFLTSAFISIKININYDCLLTHTLLPIKKSINKTCFKLKLFIVSMFVIWSSAQN